jgi:hypothetical protein
MGPLAADQFRLFAEHFVVSASVSGEWSPAAGWGSNRC